MNRFCHVGLWAIIVGCLCLCLSACKPQAQQASQSAAERDDKAPVATPSQRASADEGLIVAMGDSLTAGLGVPETQAYPAQLERRLRADGYAFEVINAGVSGETSSSARTRTAWMLTLQPDIVILETGANDGLLGVDPSVMQDNINAIVQALRAQNVVVVLTGMQMVRNLGENYTRAFAQVYSHIAQQYDLIFMPFFLEGVGGEPEFNQGDGIHPTATGYEIMVENLYPYVIEAIEKLRMQKS
jgi:acyl-CoA thioesterase-1